jgi:hypothetical protein
VIDILALIITEENFYELKRFKIPAGASIGFVV